MLANKDRIVASSTVLYIPWSAARTYLRTMPEHELFKECEVFQQDKPSLCDHQNEVARQNLDKLLVFLRSPDKGDSQAMVFISYSRDDEERVDMIQMKLEKAAAESEDSEPRLGFWRDSDIHPGEYWNERIYKQIDQSSAVLVVLTPNSVKNEWVCHEWSYAMGAKIKVMPLLVKESEEKDCQINPHLAISALQRITISNTKTNHWLSTYTEILCFITKTKTRNNGFLQG